MAKIFIKHDYVLLKKLADAASVNPITVRDNAIAIMKMLIELAENPLPGDKEDPV